MVHIFNKKSDFDLMLNIATTSLFGVLRKQWNCNSRTYLYFVECKSNKAHFIKKLVFIGFSSDVFSHSREGLFFGENTKISDIRKGYNFVANEIEAYMCKRTSICEFQIGR